MQRYYRVVRDNNGNPVSGASAMVYVAFGGQAVNATVYPTSGAATPTTSTSLPIVSASDGVIQFAAPMGTYDIFITVPGGTNIYQYAWDCFDHKDAAFSGTINSIGLSAPPQFAVTGTPLIAPGTLALAWNTQTANYGLMGPTTGAAALPTFRAFVAGDINGVAVDLTTNQTAAGNKTWSGTAAFGSTVTATGLATFNGGATVNGALALGAYVFTINIASTFTLSSGDGWKAVLFPLTVGLTTVTPTKVAVIGTIQGWSHSAAAMNDLGVTIEIPYDYSAGTAIYPYVQWTTVGTNAGVVRHGLEYTVQKTNNQGVLPAAVSIYVGTAASGTAYKLMMSEFPYPEKVGFAGVPVVVEPGAILHCRLLRDAAHANDTCTDASINLAFGIKYQVNRFATKNKTNPYYA